MLYRNGLQDNLETFVKEFLLPPPLNSAPSIYLLVLKVSVVRYKKKKRRHTGGKEQVLGGQRCYIARCNALQGTSNRWTFLRLFKARSLIVGSSWPRGGTIFSCTYMHLNTTTSTPATKATELTTSNHTLGDLKLEYKGNKSLCHRLRLKSCTLNNVVSRSLTSLVAISALHWAQAQLLPFNWA